MKKAKKRQQQKKPFQEGNKKKVGNHQKGTAITWIFGARAAF